MKIRCPDCEALAGKSTLNRLEHTPRCLASNNPEEPRKSMAELQVPYAGDILRLLRSTPGAHWNAQCRVWRAPAYPSKRLSEILDITATRSR